MKYIYIFFILLLSCNTRNEENKNKLLLKNYDKSNVDNSSITYKLFIADSLNILRLSSNNNVHLIYKSDSIITNFRKFRNKVYFLDGKKFKVFDIKNKNVKYSAFNDAVKCFDLDKKGHILGIINKKNKSILVQITPNLSEYKILKIFDNLNIYELSIFNDNLFISYIDSEPFTKIMVINKNNFKVVKMINDIVSYGSINDSLLYFYKGMDDIANELMITNYKLNPLQFYTGKKFFMYPFSRIINVKNGFLLIGNNDLIKGKTGNVELKTNTNIKKFLYYINRDTIKVLSKNSYNNLIGIVNKQLFYISSNKQICKENMQVNEKEEHQQKCNTLYSHLRYSWFLNNKNYLDTIN